MKKLIPLFVFFAGISNVSAGTSIPISPAKAKAIILDVRSSNYVPEHTECQSGTDIVRSIGDLYYADISNQLTNWTNEIQKTRPLTTEEINQFTEVKMIFLSEYSQPSSRTFILCDAMMDAFHQNK